MLEESLGLLIHGLRLRVYRSQVCWRVKTLGARFTVWQFNAGAAARQALVHAQDDPESDFFVGVRLVLWSGAVAALLLCLRGPLEGVRILAQGRGVPFAAAAVEWLLLPLDPREASVGFFGAIASLNGVLLGLYFSAYASAAASLLARLPGQVQAVARRDPAGLRYAEGLAQLTLVCLTLGITALSGVTILRAIPLVVLGWSVMVLGGGVVIARRAFNVLDVPGLAKRLRDDFLTRARKCTSANSRWRNRSWQLHNSRRAWESLRRLQLLTDYCRQHPHLEASELESVTRQAIAMLAAYGDLRRRIPSDSAWHGTRRKYGSAYRTSSWALSIAEQQGGPVGGQQEIERAWVELIITPTLLEVFTHQLSRGLVDEASSTAEAFGRLVALWAENMDWQQLPVLVTEWREVYRTHMNGAVGGQSERAQLVLAQAIGNLDVAFTRGLGRRVAPPALDALRHGIDKLAWTNPAEVAAVGFAPIYVPILEQFCQLGNMEDVIEGEMVTSARFYRNHLDDWNLKDLQAALQRFVPAAHSRCLQAITEARNNGQLKCAALLCLQGRTFLLSVTKLDEQALALAQRLKEEGWDVGKTLDAFTADIRDVRRRLLELAVAQAPLCVSLYSVPRQSDEPDWFTEVARRLGEDCIDSLDAGDAESFVALMPEYLRGAMLATYGQDGLLEEPDVTGVARRLRPIADLLDLGGYAYLYSKLRSTSELWDICVTTWDAIMEASADKTLDWLNSVYTVLGLPGGSAAQGPERFKWIDRVLRAASALPRKSIMSQAGFPVDEEIVHEDPEIRRLAHYPDGIGFDARAVFARMYLMKRPDCGARRFGQR